MTVLLWSTLTFNVFALDETVFNPFTSNFDYVRKLDSLGGDLIPDTDDTYDLGSVTLQWKDLYIDGKTYTDELLLEDPSVPLYSDSTGTTGTVAWDSDYVYICVASDTWMRSALATWGTTPAAVDQYMLLEDNTFVLTEGNTRIILE